MHVKTLRIRNFRRLKNVQVDLAQGISLFVGANNSGKTVNRLADWTPTGTATCCFHMHKARNRCSISNAGSQLTPLLISENPTRLAGFSLVFRDAFMRRARWLGKLQVCFHENISRYKHKIQSHPFCVDAGIRV